MLRSLILYNKFKFIFPLCMSMAQYVHNKTEHIQTSNRSTRFGYFDFKQKILKLYRIGAILPRFLCRIQIWARKKGLPTGQKLFAPGGDRTRDPLDAYNQVEFYYLVVIISILHKYTILQL